MPPAKSEVTNATRHSHDGIGVCSPNPPHTPAIFLSLADFRRALKFQPDSDLTACLVASLISFSLSMLFGRTVLSAVLRFFPGSSHNTLNLMRHFRGGNPELGCF